MTCYSITSTMPDDITIWLLAINDINIGYYSASILIWYYYLFYCVLFCIYSIIINYCPLHWLLSIRIINVVLLLFIIDDTIHSVFWYRYCRWYVIVRPVSYRYLTCDRGDFGNPVSVTSIQWPVRLAAIDDTWRIFGTSD